MAKARAKAQEAQLNVNVLVIGSGGREHSLAWTIAASPVVERLYCAPGNGGMSSLATCLPLDALDFNGIVSACRANHIDFVVIGPESPLVAGLADHLLAEGIKCFGPSAAAAQLEASKGFTKDLCKEFNIPTGAYERFDAAPAASAYLRTLSPPYVIKADGLAAGKGVIIAENLLQADQAVTDILDGAFGEAGNSLVIEEFLEGEEASFFALTDGETVLPLATAQDHKRVGDGDTGPNTGGMGAYSPAPIMTDDMCETVMTRFIRPTVDALASRGTPYKGVLYAGLMITKTGPQLIEYNVRFGDPECQVLMVRLMSDILPLLLAVNDGVLANMDVQWHGDAAATVVMAANGYPSAYEKGSVIGNVDRAAKKTDCQIFHAGTKVEDGTLKAAGGRVLNVTALGPSVAEAVGRAYQAVDLIDWPQGFCRRDIGWRAIERERNDA
jgi:phosphoribosylamine--glycine ligase